MNGHVWNWKHTNLNSLFAYIVLCHKVHNTIIFLSILLAAQFFFSFSRRLFFLFICCFSFVIHRSFVCQMEIRHHRKCVCVCFMLYVHTKSNWVESYIIIIIIISVLWFLMYVQSYGSYYYWVAAHITH